MLSPPPTQSSILHFSNGHFIDNSHRVNAFGYDVSTLFFGEANLDLFGPHGCEILKGKHVRPEADPILVR